MSNLKFRIKIIQNYTKRADLLGTDFFLHPDIPICFH